MPLNAINDSLGVELFEMPVYSDSMQSHMTGTDPAGTASNSEANNFRGTQPHRNPSQASQSTNHPQYRSGSHGGMS